MSGDDISALRTRSDVLVIGIPPEISSPIPSLRNYFQSKESGGGEIVDGGICLNDSGKEAIISFVKQTDAESIHEQKNHFVTFVDHANPFHLVVHPCHAEICDKYFKEDTASSGGSSDSFVVIDHHDNEHKTQDMIFAQDKKKGMDNNTKFSALETSENLTKGNLSPEIVKSLTSELNRLLPQESNIDSATKPKSPDGYQSSTVKQLQPVQPKKQNNDVLSVLDMNKDLDNNTSLDVKAATEASKNISNDNLSPEIVESEVRMSQPLDLTVDSVTRPKTPDVYQSSTVKQIQQEKEDKLKKGRHLDGYDDERHSSIEKALYESTEKDKLSRDREGHKKTEGDNMFDHNLQKLEVPQTTETYANKMENSKTKQDKEIANENYTKLNDAIGDHRIETHSLENLNIPFQKENQSVVEADILSSTKLANKGIKTSQNTAKIKPNKRVAEATNIHNNADKRIKTQHIEEKGLPHSIEKQSLDESSDTHDSADTGITTPNREKIDLQLSKQNQTVDKACGIHNSTDKSIHNRNTEIKGLSLSKENLSVDVPSDAHDRTDKRIELKNREKIDLQHPKQIKHEYEPSVTHDHVDKSINIQNTEKKCLPQNQSVDEVSDTHERADQGIGTQITENIDIQVTKQNQSVDEASDTHERADQGIGTQITENIDIQVTKQNQSVDEASDTHERADQGIGTQITENIDIQVTKQNQSVDESTNTYDSTDKEVGTNFSENKGLEFHKQNQAKQNDQMPLDVVTDNESIRNGKAEERYALPKPLMDDATLQTLGPSENTEDQSLRTVIVTGISTDLSTDMVELYFESEKSSGGGTLESIDFQENSDRVKLIFENVKSAENILLKKDYTIEGNVVSVTAFTPEKMESPLSSIEANEGKLIDEPVKIRVNGIKQKCSAEMLGLFFEHERKSGGGEISKFTLDEETRTATLIYKDNKVAERVLSRNTLTFSRHEMTVTKVEKPVWDKKTVHVTGYQSMSEEELELVYENKNKSGGGPIASIEMNKDSSGALITFENENDASQVLQQGIVKRKKNGTNIKATKPIIEEHVEIEIGDKVKEQQMTYTIAEEPVWNKKSVYVTGFQSMSEEALELLYENKKKSGGGPVTSVEMNADRSGASITFENENDASQVLQQEVVKRRNGDVIKATKPILSQGAKPKKKKEKDIKMSRSIRILGLDKTMTDDCLEMLFENEGKSDGGPIESILIDAEYGTAIITFEETRVAERVLKKEQLTFKSMKLIMQPFMEDEEDIDTTATVRKDSATDDRERKTSATKGSFNCIEVTGLKGEVSKEYLNLFFESDKQSGGGEIKSIIYSPEQDAAVISFRKESVTKAVLQRHKERPLCIDGNKLQIQPIDTSVFGGGIPAIASCALEVKGLPVNTTDDTLVMYFENRKMCGGELVEEIVHTAVEGRAVVTYRTAEVAQRVFAKHKSKPLEFESAMLDVRVICSNSRPSQVSGQKEENLLFVKNLPDDADVNDITNYMERVPHCELHKCIFGTVAGTALVRFVRAPGYEKFYELSCQKPLKGHMVDVETVPKSKSLEVFGVTGLSQQKLRLYFEHRKSRGGDVQDVKLLAEENCAIVAFIEEGVAESVLSQSDHILEKKKLTVRLHHACIGPLPPDHDTTSPCGGIPAQVVIKQGNPEILHYVLSTGSNKKDVEDRIISMHGEIIWPDQIDHDFEIFVKCLLKRTMPNIGQLVKTWEQDIKDLFQQLMSMFVKDEVNVLQESWHEFLKNSEDVKSPNNQDVQITVDDNTCTIIGIGKQSTVQQMMDNLRQVKSALEDKLNRKKQIISETISSLKSYQIKFLLAYGFPQRTMEVFQDMRIQTDLKQHKIMFSGYPGDIITAKLQMYELTSQIRSEKLKLSKPICALLKRGKTRDYCVALFEEKKCIIVYDVTSENEVMVYAKTQEELQSGVSVITSQIIERNIIVHEGTKAVLKSHKWKSVYDTLTKDFDEELKMNVADDASVIQIVSNGRVIDDALETIQNFLKENTVIEKFINMEKGTVIFITRENKQEVTKIENDFKSYSVKISGVVSNEKPGIIVHGTADGLKPAVTRVQQLVENTVYSGHQINKPGMPKYFLEERGKNVLHSLENRFRAVIVPGDKGPQGLGVEDLSSASGSKDLVSKTISIVKLSRGRNIHIVQGDITKYKVDAIVNAANERMEHVGGVAKAIVDKGGDSIQKECTRYINTHGRLLPGQVYTSQAGKLPCGKVIHTVGPRWEGGRKNEENELYETVYVTLEEATRLKLKTIALPAISSGVFGFPKVKCCDIILEAIKEFCEKEASFLSDIHLVDNNTNMVNTFKSSATTVFGRENVKHMDEPEEFASGFSSRRFQGASAMDVHEYSSSNSAPYWKKAGGNKLTSMEGVSVELVKGSIILQRVDVIINTTNPELNLGSGGVSALILKAAGHVIQQECKVNAPTGLKVGNIVQTSGGLMWCKKIYHGWCPHYNGPQCIQTLKQFVNQCLAMAHASGFKSIAFPAIGTGNLKYPRDEVAKVMYDEVRKFSETHRGTSLTSILFVVFDQDFETIKAFEKEAGRLEHTTFPGSGQNKSHGRKLAKYTENETLETEKGGISPHSREVTHLHTKHLLITLVKGDITKEDTDAIVNSTNEFLNFGSQVSKAILKAGGKEISKECTQIGKIKHNHIAVTRAGSLPCKNIIHVEAPWDTFLYIRAWKKRIGNILEKAEKMRCQSISFPALGTGVMNTMASASEMAEAMFEAFHDFGKKSGSLECIRVVVYEDKMVSTFQKELKQMGDKKKGILEIITDKMQSLSDYVYGDYEEDKEETAWKRQAHVSKGQQYTSEIDHSVMSFHIYGFSQQSCDQVAQAIDKTCDSETQDKVLESEADQKVINELTPQQIMTIKQWGRSHYVKVLIEKGHRISRIRILGAHQGVVAVMDKIYQLFREMEQVDRDKVEAELICKQVQWQFDDGSGFQNYPPEMNAVIEKAYLNKETYAEFKEENDKGQHSTVRINFKSMEETNNTHGGPKIPVKRYTPDSVKLPATWTAMKKDQHLEVMDLKAGSNEYTDVEQKFKSSFQQGGGTTYNTIVKIQRVQNSSMYRKYEVHKNHMDSANPPKTKNERILWHGTTDDTLDEIHTNGFNRSFCGRNGTAYGRGVYFATYATLSSGYAKPNASGHRHMYMCRVLTGEVITGHSSFLVPPPKNPSKPNIKYDSVVDNVGNAKIYVVFHDTQAYPDYLITFT